MSAYRCRLHGTEDHPMCAGCDKALWQREAFAAGVEAAAKIVESMTFCFDSDDLSDLEEMARRILALAQPQDPCRSAETAPARPPR